MRVRTDVGIQCPACGGYETGVPDSRPFDGHVQRRRKCQECGTKLTTTEMPGNMAEVDRQLDRLGAAARKLKPAEFQMALRLIEFFHNNRGQ